MAKLTVLIDMDDVIEDLLGAWVQALNTRFGTDVKAEDISSWEIKDYFPSLTEEQVFEPLNDEEFWRNVKPKPGAEKYIKEILNDGHEVYVVTASHPETISHKLNNVLFKYFPYLSYKDVIITSHKQMIRGDILIDDSPVNLVGGRYQGILMDMPHNRSFKAGRHKIFRAKDWAEIYDIVDELSVLKEFE